MRVERIDQFFWHFLLEFSLLIDPSRIDKISISLLQIDNLDVHKISLIPDIDSVLIRSILPQNYMRIDSRLLV